MFSRFFIDRPIFAVVLSVSITLAGAFAAFRLPVAQFPLVQPPTIQVDCNYPGANATTVSQTIAAPVEQQVNGVEGMMYMNSQSTNDGSYTLTVTFEPGFDLNLAQVLVQNRVNLAVPSLPDVVRATGVTTRKRAPEILMTIAIMSPDNRYDQLHLSNYALLRLRDELQRVRGISEVLIFGQRDYSMRVWVDPERLAARGLTAADVVAAVRQQNEAVPAGAIGQVPDPKGLALQVPLDVKGRLVEPEEFEQIAVKTLPTGQVLRVKDVGRAELGARSEDINNRFDGKPTVGLAVFLLPDANALEVADAVKAKMAELSRDFPEGVAYEIGYDTSPFIKESILEVVKSLRDAVVLVALVVLLFLQSWRSALIPLLAVPVAVVGTFVAFAVCGFSINNLTLFGLVLAIGIVVDDAIVVVEAVEYHIEHGLSPSDAAIKAMDQVSGPVVAVGFVLSAVFIPCAFTAGIIGEFFRQFALTIATSTAISAFCSLTLSPALAAWLLRPKGGRRDPLTWLLDVTLGWFFRLFNWTFRRSGSAYLWVVGKSLRLSLLVLVAYAGLVGLTVWGVRKLPTGFIPSQDQGYLIASVQMPDATAAGRTRDVIARIDKLVRETPGVKNVNSVAGNSFILSAYGPNFGSMFIILKPFAERQTPELRAEGIMKALVPKLAREVPEAQVNIFPPPPVRGIGRAGGFRIMVEDRGDLGPQTLQAQTEQLIEQANQQGALTGLFTVYKANAPQLFVDVDRDACMKRGVNLMDAFATLQASTGSRYVNDFNRFGRTFQVNVSAESRFRDAVEDVKRLKVRNNRGEMVPVGTIATVTEVGSPLVITRYNMYPAAPVNGNVAPGVSSGDALAVVEQLCDRDLPPTMGFEWTDISFIEKRSQGTGGVVFGLSVVFVFLVLAALYESWALPLAVILVVPLCVLSSIAGVAFKAGDINVFTQIGFVVLIGLACKNAILIVEFARKRRLEGADARDAVLEACRLRLRPIVMTSTAFVLGVMPLVVANGAGAEMRRALGVAVFSGMAGVTLFGLWLTPVFFFVIDRFASLRLGPRLRPGAGLRRLRLPSFSSAPRHAPSGPARLQAEPALSRPRAEPGNEVG